MFNITVLYWILAMVTKIALAQNMCIPSGQNPYRKCSYYLVIKFTQLSKPIILAEKLKYLSQHMAQAEQFRQLSDRKVKTSKRKVNVSSLTHLSQLMTWK